MRCRDAEVALLATETDQHGRNGTRQAANRARPYGSGGRGARPDAGHVQRRARTACRRFSVPVEQDGPVLRRRTRTGPVVAAHDLVVDSVPGAASLNRTRHDRRRLLPGWSGLKSHDVSLTWQRCRFRCVDRNVEPAGCRDDPGIDPVLVAQL